MMPPEQVEAAIQNSIAHHLDVDETLVFLFGSRAAGQGRPGSDYDIGLYRGRPIPLVTIAKIKDELEDYPIPVNIDLVDFSTVSEPFKQLALSTITIWNRPKRGLTLT